MFLFLLLLLPLLLSVQFAAQPKRRQGERTNRQANNIETGSGDKSVANVNYSAHFVPTLIDDTNLFEFLCFKIDRNTIIQYTAGQNKRNITMFILFLVSCIELYKKGRGNEWEIPGDNCLNNIKK